MSFLQSILAPADPLASLSTAKHASEQNAARMARQAASGTSGPLAAHPLNSRAAKSGATTTGPLQRGAMVNRETATTGSPSATASNSTSADSTITSSDFLTLLVTELKNQDPTSSQDPNAYINQLVGVNSLQQLISINQELTPSSTTTASAASANSNKAKSFAFTSGGGLDVPDKTAAVSHALDGHHGAPARTGARTVEQSPTAQE